jgi:cytoskeleton protein RodZ
MAYMPEDSKLKKGIIGPQLKTRRQALRISLAQVELDTKIRGKFLVALESGDYTSLPNDIYSRGFVQHYASYLGLEALSIAAAYAAERGGIEEGRTNRPRLDRPKRFVITAPMIAAISVIGVVLVVFSYLIWQFSSLAAPPTLTILSPESDQALTGSVIDVSGKTVPGADITINDSPVLTDTDGNFTEKVALQEGINAIRITSKSKLGKTTTITRSVLATIPKLGQAAASVPAAPFDGIAVALAVSETTSLVVAVDGVETFRGTFIAGHSQLFTGKTDINITTGNAGATSLMITNSIAANKKLSPLGREGEIRRNQIFAKDTVIP